MGVSRYIVFLVTLAIHESIQKSSPADPTYRAAVVEFFPSEYLHDLDRTVYENTEKHLGFIKQAAAKEADIVVFPEGGITSMNFPDRRTKLPLYTTLIPHPADKFSPCTNFSIPVSESLKKLSCAAKQNQIYVVVNLLEKEVCKGSGCADDGLNTYITTIALDRKGMIIARDRKFHQFDEMQWFNTTKVPDITTFETDFGVTFGLFVCFDIMFEEPTLILTRKLKVTDIAFTQGWFVETPFFASTQLHSAWAYAEDVNLLASAYSMPTHGYGGSGIYAGRQGVLTSIQPVIERSQLLVADVPKKVKSNTTHQFAPAEISKWNRDDNFKFQDENSKHQHRQKRDPEGFRLVPESLNDYVTKVIPKDGFTEDTLTSGQVKCKFIVNFTDPSPPITYRFVAHDGVRIMGGIHAVGIRTCAIIQCANDTFESCGHFEDSPTIFNSIKITTTCDDNGRTLLMPSTLATDLLTFKNWTFDQQIENGEIRAVMSLTAPKQNLVTFGVWGRNYANDFRISSGSRISNQLLCLPILLAVLKYSGCGFYLNGRT